MSLSPEPFVDPRLKVKDVGYRGIGTVVTEPIPKGTRIIAEKPLLHLPPGKTFENAYEEFLKLSDEDQETYLALHDNAIQEARQRYIVVALTQDKQGRAIQVEVEDEDADDDSSEEGTSFGRSEAGTTDQPGYPAEEDRTHVFAPDGDSAETTEQEDSWYNPPAGAEADNLEHLPPPGAESLEGTDRDGEVEDHTGYQADIDDEDSDDGQSTGSSSPRETMLDRMEIVFRNAQVQSIFETNAFTLRTAPSLERGESVGTAVFANLSRINHNCTPNAGHVWNDRLGMETVQTLRDIAPKEEISIAYVPVALAGKETRDKMLAEMYGFECNCIACRMVALREQKDQSERTPLDDARTWLEVANISVLRYEENPDFMKEARVFDGPAEVLGVLERMIQYLNSAHMKHLEVISVYTKAVKYAVQLNDLQKAIKLMEQVVSLLEVNVGVDHEEYEAATAQLEDLRDQAQQAQHA